MRHAAALLFLAVVLTAAPVRADEVRLISSVAVKAVIEALAPEFARTTKHTLVPTFGIAAALKSGIERGDPFDVAILTPAMLDELAAQGLVATRSRPVVARAGLGVMVKTSVAKPDMSSVDAFTRTLRGAKTITFVPNSASGSAFAGTLDKLGLAQEVRAKTKPAASADEVAANITNGAAELGVLPVSEILSVPGIQLGGVFPAAVQTYIVMGAGISAASPRAAAAGAFVDFLMSDRVTPTIRAKGMER